MSDVTMSTVTAEDDGVRIDRWFRNHYPALSHGHLQKMLRKGQIRLDGGRVKASHRVMSGQEIRVPPMPLPETRPSVRSNQKRGISTEDREFMHDLVLYRDDHVIVMDKPAGLAVQGGSGTYRHVDGMLSALSGKNDERPRLVHRLDKDTSGVLVLAANAPAARHLTAAFKSKECRKLYWAAVVGTPSPSSGRVDLALSKAPGSSAAKGRELVVPDETGGKRAVTYYETLENAGRQLGWLAMYPLTGRTHQLRVHATAIGHPIVGDGKYGGEEAFPLIEGLDRQLHLHARAILLPHPKGGQIEITAPLPEHMKNTWNSVGFLENDHSGVIEWPDL